MYMEINNGFQIDKLKNSFDNILQIVDQITSVKLTANNTLHKLKDAYNGLIQQNNKKIFLFCLDSFYFQYKSFQLELENLEKVFLFINNRMYCDYFKLYNMIIESLNESKLKFNEDLELRSYVPYKDLEPFKEYKLDDIKDIHTNILHIIKMLFENSKTNKESINSYYQDHDIGFSISNFINTLQYENKVLENQILLYINYISFFHISQNKYLKRCFQRFQNFYKEVEDNIHTNQSFSIEDVQNNPCNLHINTTNLNDNEEINLIMSSNSPESQNSTISTSPVSISSTASYMNEEF